MSCGSGPSRVGMQRLRSRRTCRLLRDHRTDRDAGLCRDLPGLHVRARRRPGGCSAARIQGTGNPEARRSSSGLRFRARPAALVALVASVLTTTGSAGDRPSSQVKRGGARWGSDRIGSRCHPPRSPPRLGHLLGHQVTTPRSRCDRDRGADTSDSRIDGGCSYRHLMHDALCLMHEDHARHRPRRAPDRKGDGRLAQDDRRQGHLGARAPGATTSGRHSQYP